MCRAPLAQTSLAETSLEQAPLAQVSLAPELEERFLGCVPSGFARVDATPRVPANGLSFLLCPGTSSAGRPRY